jgi:hypothetical protein
VQPANVPPANVPTSNKRQVACPQVDSQQVDTATESAGAHLPRAASAGQPTRRCFLRRSQVPASVPARQQSKTAGSWALACSTVSRECRWQANALTRHEWTRRRADAPASWRVKSAAAAAAAPVTPTRVLLQSPNRQRPPACTPPRQRATRGAAARLQLFSQLRRAALEQGERSEHAVLQSAKASFSGQVNAPAR